ncbi:Ig-like domain-containing protein [Aquimarina sp. RZ0]|uniref:RICIN domain-containing protein n=1 Tax=Aquimarina sp. RZ0 TaxID=2607730 RepID=UPI0011F20EE7|nr:Ig-like domain-containing protein [Aquimarina sp. RZ0]KAA1245802.1 T9SS type A sorting domain-containing protein [Aquimarina sp. RZ0]
MRTKLKNKLSDWLLGAMVIFFLLNFITIQSLEAQRVGDAGITFDNSKLDPDYPQMREWMKAGVEGGIPLLSSSTIKKTIGPTNSDGLNSAIDEVSRNGGGQLRLRNGNYTINKTVNVKSNVRIVGESRDRVVLIVTMTGKEADKKQAIYFKGTKRSSLERLTIKGNQNGTPDPFKLAAVKPNYAIKGIVFGSGARNCWVDKVTILNSGGSPINTWKTDHLTFRDMLVDGVWNKGGGGNGYFAIQGGYTLVYNCTIKNLRHLAIQREGAYYNVIYKNKITQDVNFHNADAGNNLVEQNEITIQSGFDFQYHAVMGPWASFHRVSDRDNYIYKNQCIERNNNDRISFSDNNTVYIGPRRKEERSRIPEYPFDKTNNVPIHGTFYPVKGGGGSGNNTVSVTGVSVSPSAVSLNIGQTKDLNPSVRPNNATNKNVTWSSSNTGVATVNSSGVVRAVSVGSAQITVKTQDGNKTATSSITVVDGGNGGDGNGNNKPPVLDFASLADGDRFDTGVSLSPRINASDTDGSIANVRLYINDDFVRQENIAPYTWGEAGKDEKIKNLREGTYRLKAIAKDNKGKETVKIISIKIGKETTSGQLIADGMYYIKSVVSNQRLISPTWDNHNARMYNAGNFDDQRWIFKHLGDNTYTIRNSGTNRYLEVPNGKCAKGANAATRIGAGSDHQKWKVVGSNGKYSLKPLHCQKNALDRERGVNDANVLIWGFNDKNQNQQWDIIKHNSRENSDGLSTPQEGISMIVYPNPANETVNLTGVEKGDIISVHDVLGKQVMGLKASSANEQISAVSLTPGMYIISVLGKGKLRLIKQ